MDDEQKESDEHEGKDVTLETGMVLEEKDTVEENETELLVKVLEVKEISKGVKVENEEEDDTEETLVDNKEKETNEDDEPKEIFENKIRQKQPWNQISSNVMSNKCPECGKFFTRKRGMGHIIDPYMKVSGILVISAIIKLKTKVICGNILNLNMKVSSILVIYVTFMGQQRAI